MDESHHFGVTTRETGGSFGHTVLRSCDDPFGKKQLQPYLY